MNVKLIHSTPLIVCAQAIRTCWNSHHRSDDGGPKDKALIYKVGNVNKHSSTLEHLVYSFDIDGISRLLLQELARHRLASLSVKSTRYTLKELRNEEFIDHTDIDLVSKYCVMSGTKLVDTMTGKALTNLQGLLKLGVINDVSKYALPEAYKVSLVWTINARSLQNFLNLRTSNAAHREIRSLAYIVYDNLPVDHKFIFANSLHKRN